MAKKKELEKINFFHQMSAQLRFSDVDNFGHVNNAVYFTLFDSCKARYFMEIIGQDALEHISYVVANVNADFLAPVFYPDEIAIQTKITKLGNKSFTMVQRAINTRTGEVKCDCQEIMVAFDKHTNSAVALPDEYKRKIAAYEKDIDFGL